MDERYRPYPFAGGLIYLDVDESPAMRQRVDGRYERKKVVALQRLLEPGMTFVDAGSNKGDFALIAARVMNDQGRVLAFEPAPENCRWIARERGAERLPLHHPFRARAVGYGWSCAAVHRRVERVALAAPASEAAEVDRGRGAHPRFGAGRDRRSARRRAEDRRRGCRARVASRCGAHALRSAPVRGAGRGPPGFRRGRPPRCATCWPGTASAFGSPGTSTVELAEPLERPEELVAIRDRGRT